MIMSLESVMLLSQFLSKMEMLSGPLGNSNLRRLLDEMPLEQAVSIRQQLSSGSLPEPLKNCSELDRLRLGTLAQVKILDDFLSQPSQAGMTQVFISEALFQKIAHALKEVYPTLDEEKRAVCDDFLAARSVEQPAVKEAPPTALQNTSSASPPSAGKSTVRKCLNSGILLTVVTLIATISIGRVQITQQMAANQIGKAQIAFDAGQYYEEHGDPETARQYYELAIEITKEVLDVEVQGEGIDHRDPSGDCFH